MLSKVASHLARKKWHRKQAGGLQQRVPVFYRAEETIKQTRGTLTAGEMGGPEQPAPRRRDSARCLGERVPSGAEQLPQGTMVVLARTAKNLFPPGFPSLRFWGLVFSEQAACRCMNQCSFRRHPEGFPWGHFSRQGAQAVTARLWESREGKTTLQRRHWKGWKGEGIKGETLFKSCILHVEKKLTPSLCLGRKKVPCWEDNLSKGQLLRWELGAPG